MNMLYDIRSAVRGMRTGVPAYAWFLLRHMLERKEWDTDILANSFRGCEKDLRSSFPEAGKIIDWGIPNRLFEFTYRLGLPRMGPGYDVVLRPHFHPLRVRGAKDVLVFHDLSFARYPGFFSRRKRLWHWLHDPMGQALRADRVIAVSESTKRDIVELFGVPEEKVRVAYSGLDPQYREDIKEGEMKRVGEKYGLEKRFVLFVGTVEPRKNVAGLIRAFGMLKRRSGTKDVELIIAGGKGWLPGGVEKALQESPARDAIRFLGHVPQEDMPPLYRLASVFAFPSFFEGFGFPPLEAQASGVPVVASLNGGLSEVLKESAESVSPGEDKDIADGLERVLSDKGRAESLVRKGRENVRRFDWSRTAEEISGICKEIL